MKIKTMLALLLAAVLSLTAFVGCTGDRNNNTTSDVSSEESSMVSSEPETSGDEDVGLDEGMEPIFFGTADEKLTAAYKAARKAVGEDGFIPNAMDDTSRLEEAYGILPELVDSAIIEIPMMSVHVGTFAGIKAKEGKGAEVETALAAYRDQIAANEMQYPMNAQKSKAGLVAREGDYVFFVMMGYTSDEAMEMSDADQLAYYKAENQKAIDAMLEVVK